MKTHDDRLRVLWLQIRDRFNGVAYHTHHLDHLDRVAFLSVRIGQSLGARLDILEAAARMHDLARCRETLSGACHAVESAIMASEILQSLDWPGDEIEPVCHAIRVHRHRTGNSPDTLEAAILQDADRLDALGAIGVARVLSHGFAAGQPLYNLDFPSDPFSGSATMAHFYEKILRLKEGLNTAPARKIAERRHAFVLAYLEALHQDIKESSECGGEP